MSYKERELTVSFTLANGSALPAAKFAKFALSLLTGAGYTATGALMAGWCW